jgi:hypothetical protein
MTSVSVVALSADVNGLSGIWAQVPTVPSGYGCYARQQAAGCQEPFRRRIAQ